MAIKYTLDRLKKIQHKNNRLSVVDFDEPEELPNGDVYKKIMCKCMCGSVVSVSMYHFIHGRVKSCGCYRRQVVSKQFQKYHPIVPGIYTSYKSMIGRCYDKSHKSYSNYGGRGVIVCDEWKNNYQTFLDWALSNGWKENYEIDKDLKGDGMLYSPDNCCWVTKLANNNNRKDNKKYVLDGELLTVAEISRKLKIPYSTLAFKIKKMGLSVNEPLSLK